MLSYYWSLHLSPSSGNSWFLCDGSSDLISSYTTKTATRPACSSNITNFFFYNEAATMSTSSSMCAPLLIYDSNGGKHYRTQMRWIELVRFSIVAWWRSMSRTPICAFRVACKIYLGLYLIAWTKYWLNLGGDRQAYDVQNTKASILGRSSSIILWWWHDVFICFDGILCMVFVFHALLMIKNGVLDLAAIVITGQVCLERHSTLFVQP
jgi:hypothetical protein